MNGPRKDANFQNLGSSNTQHIVAQNISTCQLRAQRAIIGALQVQDLAIENLNIVSETLGPKSDQSIARWNAAGDLEDSNAFINDAGDIVTPQITVGNITLATDNVPNLYTLNLPSNTSPAVGHTLSIDSITSGNIHTTWSFPPVTIPNYPNTVTVRLGVDDPPYTYGSIANALAYVSTQMPTETSPWMIRVFPGIYYESNLIIPAYVNIQGENMLSCVVEGSTNLSHVFIMEDLGNIQNFTIQGPTSPGYAGIYNNTSDFAIQFQQVTIQYCDIGLLLENTDPSNANVFCYMNDCTFSDCNLAIKLDSTHGPANVNFYGYSTSYYAANTTLAPIMVQLTGPFTIYNSIGEQSERDPPDPIHYGTFLSVENNAIAHINALELFYFDKGLFVPNDAGSPTLEATSVLFFDCAKNIEIANINTTGFFNGESPYAKTSYPLDTMWYITQKNPRILTVSQTGESDFMDIKSAVDTASSLSPSSTNQFIISVGTGEYVVPSTITIVPYITISGLSQNLTIVKATANVDVFIMSHLSTIENLKIQGPGVASLHKAIVYPGTPPLAGMVAATVQNVIFQDNWIGIQVEPTPPSLGLMIITNCTWADAKFANRCIDINATFPCLLTISNCSFFGNLSMGDPDFEAFLCTRSPMVGIPLYVNINNISTRSNVLGTYVVGTAFRIEAGSLNLREIACSSFATAINIPATLHAPRIRTVGLIMFGNTNDVIIDNALTLGNLNGVLTSSKISIMAPGVSLNYSEADGGSMTLSGNLFQGPSNSKTTNISNQIQQGSTIGIINGGAISILPPFTIHIDAGTGYVMEGTYPNDNLRYIEFVAQTVGPLAANTQYYVYLNVAGTLLANTGLPNNIQNIIVCLVTTDASGILYIQTVPRNAVHLSTAIDAMLYQALGPVFSGGCVVTNTGLQLAVTAGQYYYGNLLYSPSAKLVSDPFIAFYQVGSLYGWTIVPGATNVPTQWDNAGTLTAITAGMFIKHTFFVVGDGIYQKFFLVYAQIEFPSLAAAQTGVLNLPPSFFLENVSPICTLILDDTGTIVFIQDIRPTVRFQSGQIASTSNHNSLFNLNFDDHPQYLLVSGSRPMAGNFDMGGNSIMNVNLVDGVDVSMHGSRHNPTGADPLNFGGLPSTISTSNSQGIANAYALSDHVHAHGNQPGGSLHNLATMSTAGFMSSSQFQLVQDSTSSATPSTLMARDSNADTNVRRIGFVDPITFTDTISVGSQSGTSTYNFLLPVDGGTTAAQVLSTDGSGTTSWIDTVSSVGSGTGLTGGPITTTGTLSIANTTVTAGTYATPSNIMVNAQGQITSIQNTGTSGTVTSVTAGTALNVGAGPGGTITSTGTLNLANTAVTMGSYTNTNLTVDAQGRITNASNGTSGTVTSVGSGTGLTGGPITSTGTLSIANTAVTAGTYATPSNITVNAQGQLTSIANTGTSGTVTSVGSGTGLTGGPITSTGTLSLANTAVVPGSYTNANLTVDAQGRLTAASTGSGGGANPSTTLTIIDDFLSAPLANLGTNGVFTGGDTTWWQTTSGTGFSVSPTTVTSNETGAVLLNSGGASTNYCQWTKPSRTITVGTGSITIEFRVNMTNAPGNGTDEIAFGLFSNTTATLTLGSTNAILVQTIRPVGGGGDPNWRLVTSTSTGSSQVNGLGIPVPWNANTWTKLSFTINAAGTSVTLSVDGVVSTTNTIGIPVAASTLYPAMFSRRSVGGTVVLLVDYFFLSKSFTTPR